MNHRILPIAIFILFYAFAINGQEVQLDTGTGTLYGTLVIPENTSPEILVLLHAGSGPTDRDGNQAFMKNNSLKLIAQALAENGIASLRYDKRGIAASSAAMISEETLLFEDYVNDLRAWIEKMSREYKFKSLVVAGHSEGALIGLLACRDNPQVNRYISIAGPARPADELLLSQLNDQGPGVAEMVAPYINELKQGNRISNIPASLSALFRPSVQPYLISWFRYTPAQEIKNLTIPVLILQGNKDIQVAVSEAEMLHNAAPDSRLVVIKNMNHVLKKIKTTDKKEQLKNYGQPNIPLHKKLTKAIIRFLLESQ
ncbi:MAG: alpha/beta fold hydrolase [Bacteroidia bacterium]|nr:alpha/beta fold hydrolase [Bacteroidales bacterium]NCD42060.1 alpha/beta fold hydrolase [Bacteroidia bacterium]